MAYAVDLGAVRWFGEPWPSADDPCSLCDPRTHVPTPEGEPCGKCDEPIGADDQGIVIPYVRPDRVMIYRPWHRACFAHMVALPDETVYDTTLRVSDAAFGFGTFAQIHDWSPDPHIQEAIRRAMVVDAARRAES